MLTIARVQPQHHVLEPSAGAGDLASAIASIGVSNLDGSTVIPVVDTTDSVVVKSLTILG